MGNVGLKPRVGRRFGFRGGSGGRDLLWHPRSGPERLRNHAVAGWCRGVASHLWRLFGDGFGGVQLWGDQFSGGGHCY